MKQQYVSKKVAKQCGFFICFACITNSISCNKPIRQFRVDSENGDYVQVRTVDNYSIVKGDTVYSLNGEYISRGTFNSGQNEHSTYFKTKYAVNGILTEEFDSSVYITRDNIYYDVRHSFFDSKVNNSFEGLDSDAKNIMSNVLPHGFKDVSDTIALNNSKRTKLVANYGKPTSKKSYHRGNMKGGLFHEDTFQFENGIPVGKWEVYDTPLTKLDVTFYGQTGRIETETTHQRKSLKIESPLKIWSRKQNNEDGSSTVDYFNNCGQINKHREFNSNKQIVIEISYFISRSDLMYSRTPFKHIIRYDGEGNEIESKYDDIQTELCYQ